MDHSSQKVQGEEVTFLSLELRSNNFSSDPENGHLASKIPKEFCLHEGHKQQHLVKPPTHKMLS